MAVIGGGLVGMSLGYELVTRGLDVVLVDRHHEGRATDAGAGILAPETFLDPDDRWAELARAAGEHHRGLTTRVAEDGAGGTGHEVCGLIKVSTSPGEDEWLSKATALAERRSPGVAYPIDPAEAVGMFPALAPVRGALYNPNAARIDGRRATDAIASGRGCSRDEADRRGGDDPPARWRQGSWCGHRFWDRRRRKRRDRRRSLVFAIRRATARCSCRSRR